MFCKIHTLVNCIEPLSGLLINLRWTTIGRWSGGPTIAPWSLVTWRWCSRSREARLTRIATLKRSRQSGYFLWHRIFFLKPADKDSPFQDNHPKVLKYQLQYPVKSNKKALPVDIQTCFYWLIRLSRDESEFSVSLTLTKDDFVRLVWLVLRSLVRILSFQIQNELLVRMKCKSSQINVDYFLLVLIFLRGAASRNQTSLT